MIKDFKAIVTSEFFGDDHRCYEMTKLARKVASKMRKRLTT